MGKSELAKSLDETQAQLRDHFRARGFRKHGRAYNRTLSDGLVHVVNFQMGRYDPPGTPYIPGFRENLYGHFTVNVGVFVPEVAQAQGLQSRRVIREYSCCIRARLGDLLGQGGLWWRLPCPKECVASIRAALEQCSGAFFDTFSTRQAIIDSFPGFHSQHPDIASAPPNLLLAVIQSHLGNPEQARALLHAELRERVHHPSHRDQVRELASRLGLGELAA